MSKKNKNTPTWDEIFRGIDPPSEEKLISGKIPKVLQLKSDEPGICFGKRTKKFPAKYIGVQPNADSNAIAIGGAGSNKTAGIAKTTLQTWKGAMVVTDVKGELSDYYTELYQNGRVDRPPLVFNPMNVEGISYDPFAIVDEDGEANVMSNISAIVYSIIPDNPNQSADPFWNDAERAILQAGLLYGYRTGLSFSESICWIATSTVAELCDKMAEGDRPDPTVCMLLGDILDMKLETAASLATGLRNKILPFATDICANAFRGKREDATCFSWHDLRDYNIFLKVPIECADLCRPMVNLLISQLLRYLQKQPEKHSEQGTGSPELLLLLDEFPSFGHIRGIADGVSTLRSKRVHFFFLIQSISQLDKVYGEHDRRIIFDNCQYKVILQACDPETQRFLADMIGTELHIQRSSSKQYDEYMDLRGYTKGKSSTREYAVQPYNLANLEKCILISPYGVNEIEKNQVF